jgi:hypothetical protein
MASAGPSTGEPAPAAAQLAATDSSLDIIDHDEFLGWRIELKERLLQLANTSVLQICRFFAKISSKSAKFCTKFW